MTILNKVIPILMSKIFNFTHQNHGILLQKLFQQSKIITLSNHKRRCSCRWDSDSMSQNILSENFMVSNQMSRYILKCIRINSDTNKTCFHIQHSHSSKVIHMLYHMCLMIGPRPSCFFTCSVNLASLSCHLI